jgi:hypothetical protein
MHGPHVWIDHVQPAGRDIFVFGRADDLVVRARLVFKNGDSLTAPTKDGYFLLAIPSDHLRRAQTKAWVVGLDRQGHRPNRQGFYYKVNAS